MLVPKINISDREVIYSGSLTLGSDDQRAEIEFSTSKSFLFEFKYGDGPISAESVVLGGGKTKVEISGNIPQHIAFKIENSEDDKITEIMNVSVRSQKEAALTTRVIHYTLLKV